MAAFFRDPFAEGRCKFDANGSMVETMKYDSMSARRKSTVKKILCLSVSGIREDWACDTFDLPLVVVRLGTPLPVVKSSRTTGKSIG